MWILPVLFRTTVFFLALNFLIVFHPSHTFSVQEINYPLINDFPFPKSVSLFGEQIPLKNRRVWEMLDREFTISVWRRSQVLLWLKRAGRYFPYIETKLAEADMPIDLKYLAVAESNLLTTIRSRKGAVGMWQIITKTAKRNGLRVDLKIDERRSFERSTEAAIKYLRSLKEMLGTWALALAAYNCGEERMEKEIEEQKVRDYYRLNLPLETERFLFRIAAIKIIMENPARYGYMIPPEQIYRPILYKSVPVKVDISLPMTEVAQAMDIDFKTIKEINPHILSYDFPKGSYPINVPSGFGSKLADILSRLSLNASHSKETDTDRHTARHVLVQQGDTLSDISQRTGVPVSTLKRLNGINGSFIRVGQQLKIVP